MAFTYTAGSDTPDYSGLFELPGLRFTYDGSFRPLIIPPLAMSAPLRISGTDLPGDGGILSDPKLAWWQFDVTGWLYDADIANIQGGIDYLLSKANSNLGWMTAQIRGQGWTAAQTMTVRVFGQVSAEVPEKQELQVPERTITIPLAAADPRRYGAPVSTTVTTSTNITNAGTTPTPIDVTFNGPRDMPLLNGPGGGNSIRVNRNLASGQWVRVQTVDPTTGLVSATDETGADAYADVDVDRCRYVDPGTEAWTVTSNSGTGAVVVTVSPAYG